jgi:hypothetical protein
MLAEVLAVHDMLDECGVADTPDSISVALVVVG